jgi:hypothetical protein
MSGTKRHTIPCYSFLSTTFILVIIFPFSVYFDPFPSSPLLSHSHFTFVFLFFFSFIFSLYICFCPTWTIFFLFLFYMSCVYMQVSIFFAFACVFFVYAPVSMSVPYILAPTPPPPCKFKRKCRETRLLWIAKWALIFVAVKSVVHSVGRKYDVSIDKKVKLDILIIRRME